jgi:hypothetical protein
MDVHVARVLVEQRQTALLALLPILLLDSFRPKQIGAMKTIQSIIQSKAIQYLLK